MKSINSQHFCCVCPRRIVEFTYLGRERLPRSCVWGCTNTSFQACPGISFVRAVPTRTGEEQAPTEKEGVLSWSSSSPWLSSQGRVRPQQISHIRISTVAHKQLRRCWRRGISTCDSLPKAPSCTLALEGGGSATFFVVFAVKSKMSLSLLTMPLMKIHSLGKDLKSYLPALR